ncbi:MAG: hypothetical protein M3Q29_02975 [Chloroflexota bacterium]|nr:hypothetical protein [Chloroflexota bacterium]
MLESFTVETFSRHLGDTFRLHHGSSEPLAVKLIEATVLREVAGKGSSDLQVRSPFSIVFRSARDALLSQRIYQVEYDTIGAFELFLVPIGPDRDGQRYEAVFA